VGLFNYLVVIFLKSEKAILEDRDLCSNLFVSPFTIEVEFLNVHEASHLTVQFFMLHTCQHICLEVGVSKRPVLDLGNQDKSDKAIRHPGLFEFSKPDALGDNEIKRVPTLLVVIVVPVVQKIRALVNWNVKIVSLCPWVILGDSWAQEDGHLE